MVFFLPAAGSAAPVLYPLRRRWICRAKGNHGLQSWWWSVGTTKTTSTANCCYLPELMPPQAPATRRDMAHPSIPVLSSSPTPRRWGLRPLLPTGLHRPAAGHPGGLAGFKRTRRHRADSCQPLQFLADLRPTAAPALLLKVL
jgi:hypothetical protein